ncbi:hypothetical protein CJF31_00002539 [Rutstroemia sp. NJR-2017a BVV2]|nr:hypothetical protein CJF31_00002539 [Rutstroemia sp. NJR-2017a BVV2]
MIFTRLVVTLVTLAYFTTSTISLRIRDNDPAPGGLNFTYPYPVHFYNFTSQQQPLTMAYMDVRPHPHTPYKGVIALLHGKNFCGATWNRTIASLSLLGYRLIVPDQIGFCKSSKPLTYQFSLHQLATNTNALLRSLNITSATIMGHSMGGMLTARYALTFPSQVVQIIMVSPLGLEDWQAKGVPYQAPDKTFVTELATTFSSIKTYEQSTYYGGTWLPAYDVWVNMLLAVYQGAQGRAFAWNMALVTDAIFTQPVLYQFGQLGMMRSLLVVGELDNTAIGKAWAPKEVQAILGDYKVLGVEAKERLGGNCTLVELEGVGHSPQIQDFGGFEEVVTGWLG